MQPSSLAWRTFVALALMIGFYVFAIAIVLILLGIPIAEWQYLHRIDFRIAAFCIIGAIIIAISIFPRPDQFVPPGPPLDAAQHPELFVELIRTAKSVEQAMPREVYLVPEVNAWVAQRGGVMGFGSRRVMGLGLPLLQILTVSELRAVLAHEFGHFYGGDTRLGPWVYKTRGAIVRTVVSLHGQSEFLQTLFVGYAKLFLRITQAISRQQEYSADALSARTVGALPLINGLRLTHGAGQAFVPYWRDEVAPVLNAGFRPPIAEGFAQFVKSPNVAQAISQVLANEINASTTDPYDTHPPLRDRIAAIEKFPAPRAGLDERPAIALLQAVGETEQQLLVMLAHNEPNKKFEPIDWSSVGTQVYLPSYRKMLSEYGEVLSGITPVALPAVTSHLHPFLQYLEKKNRQVPSTEDAKSFGFAMIGAAIVLMLDQRGWSISALPGTTIMLQRGEMRIEPFNILAHLVSGELTADAWRAQCAAIGIADVDLRIL